MKKEFNPYQFTLYPGNKNGYLFQSTSYDREYSFLLSRSEDVIDLFMYLDNFEVNHIYWHKILTTAYFENQDNILNSLILLEENLKSGALVSLLSPKQQDDCLDMMLAFEKEKGVDFVKNKRSSKDFFDDIIKEQNGKGISHED